ncbi:MAG TPA: hypothetical protein VGH24_09805 [Solirubrobacteraceae bacterium]|jgi:hypothetical protein
MGPLQLANWREINRLFCGLVWIVAVVLAVVIIGHLAGATSACASKASARGASACAVSASSVRVLRR